MKPYKIAFVKFGGLSAGGTERWLQMMAANCNKNLFDIDYFYCDAAPYVNSNYKHAETDPDRMKYLKDAGINLIKFNVGAKDIRYPHHPWIDTDFWDLFDGEKYDLVQTAKAGHREYPFCMMNNRIIEYVTLSGMVDQSSNIAKSILISYWSKNVWINSGGEKNRCDVIYIPVEKPITKDTFRDELGIPASVIVCGFHQRNDDNIFSPFQLQAISNQDEKDLHILILGGGERYRGQVTKLNLKNVHFISHTGDQCVISKFLNTIDIFTHGRSDGETFGTVLAEAMMHGKPCISHYVQCGANAMAETIGPGGYVVNSVDEYTKVLTKLINNPTLRKNLGDAAKSYAHGNYSIDVCVHRLEKIWLDILDNNQDKNNKYNSEEYKQIPFGKTRLGFFYAGNNKKRSEIAYEFITRKKIPELFEVSVFSSFIPFISSFIDIGSNTGLYSVIAAALSGGKIKSHAIDPQEECCRDLLKTVEINGWKDRLTVHCLGLGETNDKLTLHLTGSGSSFFNEFNDNQLLPKRKIQVIPLDLFVTQNQISHVDFIKIDVEGFELSVLKGGEKTIDFFKPVIFVEIADSIKGRQFKNPYYKDTLNWLREKGYLIYRCTEDQNLIHLTENTPYYHIAMYLCVNPLHTRAIEFLFEKLHDGTLINLPMKLASQQSEYQIKTFGFQKRVQLSKFYHLITNKVKNLK